MKTNRYFLLSLIVVLVCCKTTKNKELAVLTTLSGDSGITYNESIERWSKLKSTNGNSYTYQTTFVSWAGFGNMTELEIKDGVVLSRKYEEFRTNQSDGQREVIDSYSESKADLGNHDLGARPLTIDDLYDSCANEFLTADQEKNTLQFETEKDGLLKLCGFVPIGCVDDCYKGVRINSFKWTK